MQIAIIVKANIWAELEIMRALFEAYKKYDNKKAKETNSRHICLNNSK